jgi:hypothetical protein
MSGGPFGLTARLALSACAGAVFFVPGAAAKDIAPFHMALAVRWGAGAGSDAFLDDLSRSLAATLATGCFATVSIAPSDGSGHGADLDFEVVLSNVVDETRFDDSVAGTMQPGEPTKELGRTTHFEVTVDARLSARVNGALVHHKHLVANVSRRPIYVGEDAQATARAEAIDNIVRDLSRALGCGKAKLAQKVREAIGDAGQTTPGPR